MRKSIFSRSLPAVAVVAALLAGCSGSQGVNPATSSGGSSLSPSVKGGCQAHGGVRVTPCSVTFTASSSGPDTVTVRIPKTKKGTLSEGDNCGGPSGIATVTQGTGNGWIVTAGSSTGSCTATFSFDNKRGKTTGWADLSITNDI